MEEFDCAGSGPRVHGGEGGGDGEGEHGSGDEEGSGANALALDEALDMTRDGAWLVLSYDPSSNSFRGTVENMTEATLDQVRIEVHLSNEAELGPTTPTEVGPGEVLTINLPATEESFTEWTGHIEVGRGEHGNESG